MFCATYPLPRRFCGAPKRSTDDSNAWPRGVTVACGRFMSEAHLRETAILDYTHEAISRLIQDRGWASLPVDQRVGAVYAFVRDEIGFGYNTGDSISASQVLADGYGQCNTKTTLLMALLRAVGVPARLHGATIHKRLQKGVVTGPFYWLAPTNIIHSWAEVLINERWVALEGVILDKAYLEGLRVRLPGERGALLGYGVGTESFLAPPIEWRGVDTRIQMTGVNQDLGVFETPDTFYAKYGGNLSGMRGWLYRHWVRHTMNRRVASIRGCREGSTCALGDLERAQ